MTPFRTTLVLAIVGLTACATVPGTGRTQLLLLSADEEVRMGHQAWQQVLGEAKVSKNTKATALVTKVGKRIAAGTGRDDFEWEFVVLEDDTANAFCLPGGKVAVHTGILAITKNEAGLATVIGHEVAHAIARHGGERISQGLLASIGAAAAAEALGSGEAGTRKAVDAAFGIGVGIGVLLPFSRTHESEADRLGLSYMAKAGYHPREALKFWNRMNREGGSSIPEFLSSHPSHETRVAQLRSWLPEALRVYEER